MNPLKKDDVHKLDSTVYVCWFWAADQSCRKYYSFSGLGYLETFELKKGRPSSAE